MQGSCCRPSGTSLSCISVLQHGDREFSSVEMTAALPSSPPRSPGDRTTEQTVSASNRACPIESAEPSSPAGSGTPQLRSAKSLCYCTEPPAYSDMDRSYSHLPAIPPEPDDEHHCSPCFRRGTPVVTGLPAFFLRSCVTVERTIKRRDCDTRRPSESRHATSTQLCGSSLSKPVAARLSQRIPLSRRREQARTAWQSRSR